MLIPDLSGKYQKNVDMKHYMNENSRVYSDKLSKLMFQKDAVRDMIMNRLSKMYDVIFIDEVQDMASWDLELIKEIHNSGIGLIMVGDMLQRTYVTTKEKKNIKNKKPLNIQEFIIDKVIDSICIDPETLKKTHRCSQKVCEYINKKFNMNIDVCDCCDRTGMENCNISFIEREEIEEKLKSTNTMQILYDKNSKYNKSYPAINMGKSKGLDYSNVVIYPTKTMIDYLHDSSTLPDSSKSKLYVALTRARKNVYIIKD